MKFLRKMLAAGVFVSGILTGSSVLAAEQPLTDHLPDLGASASSQGKTPTMAESLKQDAVCTKCHDENETKPVLSIYATRHGVKADARTPTCQACHGESEAHVKNVEGKETRPAPDVLFGTRSGKNSSFRRSDAEAQNKTCMVCHQNALGKRTYWAGSQHQKRNVACVSCHEVHAKDDKVLTKATQPEVCYSCHKEQRAQAQRISTHPIAAGKVGCSDCHNPHGSAGPKLLVKNTVNETCYTCHAEKRGPFLWEHPPATDDCMNCHTPHGSTNAPLLKARAPWLCQQCHGDGAPHPGQVYSAANLPDGAASNNNIGTTAAAQAINPITGTRITRNNPESRLAFRGCPNCHSQIHGSNHPGGNRFLR
ncbi:MAG TPA: DmsE family decaheme c-type cytochrome [Novimethylophilus sp.]|jgi:DmsE family decaheme c-type cytochrome|uniref:DmsE family decaheme c-type cytochrome n=1 Tax=Novimethylophilus sp. TaxID=2137426 RepID=UPI002F4212B4